MATKPSKPPSIKKWELQGQSVVNEEIKKDLEKVISISMEEAFHLSGTAEGKRIVEQLVKTTGYLMEYTLFKNIQKTGVAALTEESEQQGYKEDLLEAKSHVKNAKETKKPEYLQSDMKEEYLLALSLYTSNGCFPHINQALRTPDKGESVLKYSQFAASFIKGFRLLPSYWGIVYRGTRLDPSGYKVGNSVLFHGFTSTSKKKENLKKFMYGSKDEKQKSPIMFTIHSKSGRCLEDLSFFKDEQEVAFRPYTTFKVMKVETKAWELMNDEETYFIELEELYPDIRGRKVLVWIDDKRSDEIKEIMDKCERNGVTFVNLRSTDETKTFFSEAHGQALLLKRDIDHDIDQMRIITNMVRTNENGVKNIEAGIEVAKLLQNEFKYYKPILCYTGPMYVRENAQKIFNEKLMKVFVTAEHGDALEWARFLQIPTGVKKLLSS